MKILRSAIAVFCILLILLQCGCVHITGPVDTEPTESTPQPRPTEPTNAQPTDPPVTETDPPETDPPATDPPATEPPATEPPATEPPATDPPVTEPPETRPPETGDPEDMIGDLYTRGQLLALDNTLVTYGCGTTKNGKRALYAEQDQQRYGDENAIFIGEDESVIYLTFDCGYEYNNNTAAILDVLAEKNVKAVFFITGNYAKKNPELVRRMIAEGHTVGSHSNTHPDMTTLDIDGMAAQLTTIHEYVKKHYGYEMTLFRPPQGRFSHRSLAVAASFGYKSVLWSVAYVDYDVEDQPDPDDALKTMKKRAHNGAIYLLHAISDTNVAILGDLIDYLQSEGYTIDLLS